MANPAWKTAEDIAEGYVTLNPVVLKKLEKHELDQLVQELAKVLRDVRVQVVPPDDSEKAQAKSRKMLRISQAQVVLQGYRSRMGR